MTIRLFWRRIPAEIIFLFLIDGLILFASMYYGVALRYVIGNPYEYGEVLPVYPRAIAYTVVMLVILISMRLYARGILRGNPEYYIRFVASFLIGAMVMVMIGYMVPGLFLGRGSIALTALLALMAIAAARYFLFRCFVLDNEK